MLRRSHSVREQGVDGNAQYWINYDTPEARLRKMDLDLLRNKSSKQPKKNSNHQKIRRERLGDIFSKFMLYNHLPFHVANSP